MNRFNLMHRMISVVLEAVVLYLAPVLSTCYEEGKNRQGFGWFLVGFGLGFFELSY